MIPRTMLGEGLAAILLLGSAASYGHAELKVEFTMPGRPNAVDPAYVPWAVSGSVSAQTNFGKVSVTVSNVGPWGVGLKSGWWKDGAESATLNAKMISDGITVDNPLMDGARIEMRFAGLTPGRHTLLTWHNAWDNPTNPPSRSFSKIDIFLNGAPALAGLRPSARATNNSLGASVYLEFEAQDGQDTVIHFEADRAEPLVTDRNVVINAFELDTENAVRQASRPSPADRDEHVDGSSGSVFLSWAPAAGATAHHLFFGSDSNVVATALVGSPQYVGTYTTSNHVVESPGSRQTWFWRVDEVHPNGVARGQTWSFRIRRLAFAGAEGYGRFARGGRGGKVVEVTNLLDSGPGSLRHAVTNDIGPRTILFAVGGLITLESRLTVSQPHITIAGQTAPGKGICIRQFPFGLSGARDVIIRHVRVRPGNISGQTIDGMGMQGSDHCIIDHCSISWSIDEAFSSRSARNITLQRTLISEALNAAGHQNYPPGTQHGYAASVSGGVGSLHHNLLAHCAGRNWSLAGGLTGGGAYDGYLDIRNNVVYNWKDRTTDGGAKQVNFVANYYRPGPATTLFLLMKPDCGAPGDRQTYHITNNVLEGRPSFFPNNWNGVVPQPVITDTTFALTQIQSAVPFFPDHVSTLSATNTLADVLSDVGCTQPQFDTHDQRIVRETRDHTFTYSGSVTGLPGLPDAQSDVGGWEDYPAEIRSEHWDTDHDGLPNWWEIIKGLNPNSAPGDFTDANADPDGDEFTNLEDYLQWMAEPHGSCVQKGYTDFDLSALTRGFAGPVTFTFAQPQHGLVTLLQGTATARFKPEPGFTGLDEFSFAVRHTDGVPFSRTVRIHVHRPPALAPLLHFERQGNLRFQGEAGRSYRLQISDRLPDWRNSTNIIATGTPQFLPVTPFGNVRFFRLVTDN